MKSNRQLNKRLEQLSEAIIALKTPSECRAFLRDLCTLSELEAMNERLQVAKLLREGLSYRRISEQTGSSTATVTRVAYWLNNGTGGYTTVLDRLGLSEKEGLGK